VGRDTTRQRWNEVHSIANAETKRRNWQVNTAAISTLGRSRKTPTTWTIRLEQVHTDRRGKRWNIFLAHGRHDPRGKRAALGHQKLTRVRFPKKIGNDMDELDRLYARLLQVGLLVLRQAIESGNQEWARAEAEFLHNVPSLLGEDNVERHRYFWNEERNYYLDWINTRGSEESRSRMRTFYEPIWNDLGPLISERLEHAEHR
jgi:hypothetical protein